MDGRGKSTRLNGSDKVQIMLDTIVDAMLDAEADLQHATLDQWERILVDSCRRKKEAVAVRRRSSSMAA